MLDVDENEVNQIHRTDKLTFLQVRLHKYVLKSYLLFAKI